MALLRSGETSAVELLHSHLARVEERNPEINAIVALDPSVGLAKAKAVDATLARGDDPGPLAGLVTAVKDLADTKDFVTTQGSPVWADHRPTVDALHVQRMNEAGVVAIGKTNTPEFGAGSHSFNPVYGVTRNPFNTDLSAGGSSGGAAAALTTNMVAIADGSDYGGSLRNPAAWNNVVGFRNSLGVIPDIGPGNAYLRLGIVGAMARNVEDLALMLGVISAPDSRDPSNRGLAVPSTIEPVRGPLTVAWSDDIGGLPVAPEIRTALTRVRAACEDLGWRVVETEPDFSGADECFETIRSWGMANGHLSKLGDGLKKVKSVIQDEVARGQALGADDVARAIDHMKVLWHRSHSFFDGIDLMIGPVTQVSPFSFELEYPTEIEGVTMDRYITWMRSVCRITSMQLPALSLPAGFTDAGLPVGAQIIGGPRDDIGVLRAALTLEQALA